MKHMTNCCINTIYQKLPQYDEKVPEMFLREGCANGNMSKWKECKALKMTAQVHIVVYLLFLFVILCLSESMWTCLKWNLLHRAAESKHVNVQRVVLAV